MNHLRTTLAAAAVTGLAFAGIGIGTGTGIATAHAASAISPVETPKVLLILDVSGSMKEKDASGQSKIDGAKAALKKVVAELPETTRVGLRVYGSEIDASKEQDPAACRDTRLVAPIAPLDRAALTTAIDSFQAKGETPMAYSLEQGVEDLGTTGKRTIVLVSDGEERCVPDPCPVAQKLAGSGVDLQFNAIGLSVDDKTRSQLQCIASAGRGQYVDVKDSAALAPALTRVSTRTTRGFAVQGQRIDATQWETDAPTVGAGQYIVTLPAEVKGTVATRWVKINRSIPGSTLNIGLTAQTQRFSRDSSGESLGLRTSTVTADAGGGRSCESDTVWNSSSHAVSLLSTGVTVAGTPTPPSTLAADEAADLLKRCDGASELYVQLTRDGGRAPTPLDAELLVIEEPPLTSTAGLPIGPANFVAAYQPVAAAATPAPVVGGRGFSDAPALTPGSYTETYALGDTVVYKVRLEPGQQALLTAELPASPQNLEPEFGFQSKIRAYSPNRYNISTSERSTSESVSGNEMKRITAMTPVVEWTNRTASSSAEPFSTRDMRAAAMPGWYYFSVNLDPNRAEGVGHQVPVRVSLRINGTPSGAIPYSADVPAFATPTDSPTDTPATGTDAASTPVTESTSTPDAAQSTTAATSGSSAAGSTNPTQEPGLSPAAWVGGGVGMAALLGLLGWFGLRRKAN